MSGRLETALDILEEVAAEADRTDILYDIRNVQQLLLYELEQRDRE